MIEKELSTHTYRKHQEKLFELVHMPIVTEEGVQQAIHLMCETVADMLHVDHVSIWQFDQAYESIECPVTYSRKNGLTHPKITIPRTLAPECFRTIETNRVLSFADVRKHPWIDRMYADVFTEDRVQSMIVAPIYVNNRVTGLLCCETFTTRVWTDVEELIVSTLTDFIAILYFRLDRKLVDDHIRRLAYTDELTGLLNENGFIEAVDPERLERTDGLGALLYIKVDDFRSIEDAIGLEKSDALVREVARRLRSHIGSRHVARISQSGFALWVPEIGRDDASILAGRLCDVLVLGSFNVGELEVILTMSAFIAMERSDHSTLEMIHTARIAASVQGTQRAGIVFYEEEMGMKATNRLLLEMNLRKGITDQEFTLFYQPKIDTATGRLKGFEGLMRWLHPEKGLIPPLDFIPLAESTGVIIELEEWSFVSACHQLKAWHDQGNYYELALNLSARHFLSDGVVEKFSRIAEEIGVCPNYLTLEITESVGMENQQHVIDRFIAFREKGFSISIDDFGTGFSAFVYLKHYPIHEIKIDRQFIQVTENDPTGNAIVQSIVELARGLDLKTVCEGVETSEQHDALQNLGCDEVQGYYFSKPLPLDELEIWIANYETQ